ncbi:MAG TPA: rRNA maturation RNase YbeY [Chryseolinea sp.]|nr:rRNA maturation RNase YbeY [Chryseolinea sp.]
MPSIRFFYEDVKFRLPKSSRTRSWIKAAILSEKRKLGELNYIFCSDEDLAVINRQYLNHNTFTDIITFDGNEGDGYVQGDIYISVDRVRENALMYKTEFSKELHRVIIHGVLHLIGYSDKSKSAKVAMRYKEDAYLSLLNDL